MYDDSAMIMTFNTLTSTHPGSGTELSFVDMPIQREGHTGYPKVEASTLKGCMRYQAGQNHKEETDKINRIFGMPDKGAFASAVSITDARILFFPVKSAKGVFGWITCPFVIKRFLADYKVAKGACFMDCRTEEGACFMENLPSGNGLIPAGEKGCESELAYTMKDRGADTVYDVMLEDYTYKVKKDTGFRNFVDEISKILPENSLIKDMLKTHAVLVGDDDFAEFVKHSTEVSTRIRIDGDTGTAAGKGLFSEEFLPPECVFYSLIFCTQSHLPQEGAEGMVLLDKKQVKKEFRELCPDGVMQIGADSTLGKGLVEYRIWEEEKNEG